MGWAVETPTIFAKTTKGEAISLITLGNRTTMRYTEHHNTGRF